MSKDTVVPATFQNEESADVAAEDLKESGVAQGDAIGVLALNDRGQLKTDKVGKRSAGKGAGIGAIAALVTPVGLVAGLVGGGLLGSGTTRIWDLDKADRARLGSELEGGKRQSACWFRSPTPASWPTSSPPWGAPRRPTRSPPRPWKKPRRPQRRRHRNSPGPSACHRVQADRNGECRARSAPDSLVCRARAGRGRWRICGGCSTASRTGAAAGAISAR